jgi:hypothetical protein
MDDLPRIIVVMALRLESSGVFEAAGVPVLYCPHQGAVAIRASRPGFALGREFRFCGKPLPCVWDARELS